jgi:hypothetical protein
MMLRRFHVVLPVLVFASTAQPAYRLGGFIEAQQTSCRPDGMAGESQDDGDGESTDGDRPEPVWPIELVALFPAGIGTAEQAFRAPTTGRVPQDSSDPLDALRPYATPAGDRTAMLVVASHPGAASFAVVARPILTHAPPGAL